MQSDFSINMIKIRGNDYVERLIMKGIILAGENQELLVSIDSVQTTNELMLFVTNQ